MAKVAKKGKSDAAVLAAKKATQKKVGHCLCC